MIKESFYFSHDYNTRSDIRIKSLIRKHGMSGYGVFWCIVEDLYNNANALPTDYDGIADDLRLHCDIIKSVINDFDLFVIKDGQFGSMSVERRLDERNKKSETARESAFKRWGKKKRDANALRTQCKGNAIKERKVKERKEEYNKDVKNLYDDIVIFFDEDCRPKTEAEKINWYDVLDKMIRIDGRDPEHIKNIIKRTRMDDFWRQNFLSVLKLRKKNKDGISYFTVFEKKITKESGNNISRSEPKPIILSSGPGK